MHFIDCVLYMFTIKLNFNVITLLLVLNFVIFLFY